MDIKGKYLIILILILLTITVSISYSYFGANIIHEGEYETKVSTGLIDIKINDKSVNASNVTPIYDEYYELLAYDKEFSLASTNDSLNSCTKIYLNINSISDSLKSKYLKYVIKSSNGEESSGTFENANNNEKMLILDNVFINSGEVVNFDLYIWISYQDNIDQTDMLNSEMVSNISIEGVDTKSKDTCNNNKLDE